MTSAPELDPSALRAALDDLVVRGAEVWDAPGVALVRTLIDEFPTLEAQLHVGDVADTEAVIATLLAHPRLLQRPILIRDGVAIIGRPKDRAAAFLAGPDV